MSDLLIIMKQELMVIVIIFFLLFVKLGKGMKNETLLPLIQILLLLQFIAGFFFNQTGQLFGDMFYTNGLIAFEKAILSFGVYLISLLSSDWLKQSKHMPEYFMLMLAALLGMDLLISSGNLLMFYLALELATIPIAAMANFDLEKKQSSEGAMKFILSAAFSSGILLFGISLIYGITGTISFAALSHQAVNSTLLILAFVFFFTAFGFKMSIVPFHLWTADVYQGSPIATTSFLSVISKGSVAFIFITILYKVFGQSETVWYWMLVVLSVATMLIGNLFALRQQNIKRFLAFSSIAQVGFILVAISGGYVVATSAVVYFILIYIFSNLAVFGVAEVITNATGRETINDYKGLYRTNPFLSWIMALAMFSLAGIPPTAGFFGKLMLLTAGSNSGNFWFILIAGLNMVISLYYYLIVVRAIFMDKNENPIAPIKISVMAKYGMILCAAGIILVGLIGKIYEYIQSLI
ncbi:MAG: NADH-quinone oxidoreductase subunit N [Bacteroidetes bacterium]|nr:NADH-quinone oxidoreductase subunit N [Bacteroidota bacterium]